MRAGEATGPAARPATFVNLTTAGILFPPFPGMGAYVSSKMAAVKLLQAFAAENPHVRLHHVHPSYLDTAMSAQLAQTTKLPFSFDDSESLQARVPPPSVLLLTFPSLRMSLAPGRLPRVDRFGRGQVPQRQTRLCRVGRRRAQEPGEGDCRWTSGNR